MTASAASNIPAPEEHTFPIINDNENKSTYNHDNEMAYIGQIITNEDGYFLFADVPAGAYQLNVSYGDIHIPYNIDIDGSGTNYIQIDLAGNEVPKGQKYPTQDDMASIEGYVSFQGIGLSDITLSLYADNKYQMASKDELTVSNLLSTGNTPLTAKSMTTNPVEKKGSLKVSIVDSKGNPLDNGIIALFDKSEKQYILRTAIEYVNAEGTGVANFTDLDAGEYIVKVMTAPKGYTANSEAYPVEVEPDEEATLSITHKTEEEMKSANGTEDKTAGGGSDTENKTANGTDTKSDTKEADNTNATQMNDTKEGSNQTAGTTKTTNGNKSSEDAPLSENTSPQTSDNIDVLQRTMMVNMIMLMVCFVGLITVIMSIKRSKQT